MDGNLVVNFVEGVLKKLVIDFFDEILRFCGVDIFFFGFKFVLVVDGLNGDVEFWRD